MKQSFLSGIIVSVLAILFIGTTSCQESTTSVQIKDSLEIELDKLLPGLLKNSAVPGVSIAIIREGKLVLAKGYGVADKSSNTPVTTHTKFQVGSVSKTITAMSVLKLAEEGKINLDSPIESYLKSWHLPQANYDKHKVTIRMVLSHTAGLSVTGYHGVFKPGDKLPTLEESLNGYEGSDGALQVASEPGKTFRYSSGGYTLLQLLIQDVTGLSFAEYVNQRIFIPLGMKNSVYSWSKELEATVATPYDEKGNAWPHYQFVESGSGGVYTTPTDLAKFLTVLLKTADQKKIIKTNAVDEMITPAEGTGNNYGLGCKIFPINENQKVITHDGANEGWRAAYYIYPPSGDGVVMMTNSDVGGKAGAPIICTVFKKTVVDFSGLCTQLPKEKK